LDGGLDVVDVEVGHDLPGLVARMQRLVLLPCGSLHRPHPWTRTSTPEASRRNSALGSRPAHPSRTTSTRRSSSPPARCRSHSPSSEPSELRRVSREEPALGPTGGPVRPGSVTAESAVRSAATAHRTNHRTRPRSIRTLHGSGRRSGSAERRRISSSPTPRSSEGAVAGGCR
jgi:hypothetical protein